jgi:tripartite-type tricarboxylate transporter receptor subunit TctC
MFGKTANVKMVHIPYKGLALATQDLIGDQISSTFSDIGSIKPFIQSGKVKALAVIAPKRLQALPDVPTFSEHGMNAMDSLVGWTGVLVPTGTPSPVVTRLALEISKIVRTPEVSAQLVAMGMEPTGTTHAEAAAILLDDLARWGRVMKELGPIKAE